MAARESSVKGRIAEQEQQDSISELLTSLNEMRQAQEVQTSTMRQLVESQNSVVSMMKEMNASRSSTESSLSGNDLMQALSKHEEALLDLGKALVSSEAVKLPSGETVRQSELDSLALVQRIEAAMKEWSSEHRRLAEAVTAKSTIKVDSDKVANVVAHRVDKSIDQRLQQTVKGVEKALSAQERRLEALGEQKTAEKVEAVQAATKALEDAATRMPSFKWAMTWHGVGRVCLALIPFAMVFVALAYLVGLGSQVLGVGPVFAWAWSSFEAAQAWWSKLIIAVLTLGSAGGLVWLVCALGRRLTDAYRGW